MLPTCQKGLFPPNCQMNPLITQELENEVRLRGTTALQSPDQFHNKHFVNVTDRRTDGRTIYNGNTAFCTKVHRAVKTVNGAYYYEY